MSRSHTSQTDLFTAPQTDRSLPSPDPRELAMRWVLWSVEGIGPHRLLALERLTQHALERLWQEPRFATRCLDRLRLGARALHTLKDRLSHDPLDLFSRELERLGPHDHLVHVDERAYPAALLELGDSPEFLYLRGDKGVLCHASRLAVVGSRHIPASQEREARHLCRQLASASLTLVSGGARGMDTAAHQGALDATAPTIAVLPGGLDQLAPRQNVRLFQQIVETGGALLSEYPFEVAPRRYHYPRRNRLIASLGRALLVLKAAETGGSLLTVAAARELGRPILALPYEASDVAARGSHALIRSPDVVMVCDVEEILRHGFGQLAPTPATTCEEEMPHAQVLPAPELPSARSSGAAISWPEQETCCEVDQLAAHWKIDVARAQVRLFELELEGAVQKVPGSSRYSRV